MKRYILGEIKPAQIKIGMKIRTNFQRTASDWVEGQVISTHSGGFTIDNAEDSKGGCWGSWNVSINSTSWIESDQFDEQEEPKKKCKVDFETVIMSDEKKDQIKQAISQIGNNKLIFEKWGFGDVFEKGTAVSLLFYGVPGTGKTLMAQAIADKMGQKLLVVGPAEIETSTPGGAERNIQRFFKTASGKIGANTGETNDAGTPIQDKPCKCVLLFDECDSLITNRDNVGIIMRGQINTLLSELENFDGIVIFTTNSIKSLDPAMERRITAKIEFDFPDKEARYKIWKRMIPKKAPIARNVSFHKLAEFPFAGGNIKNIVLNAARNAAYLSATSISYDCFITAMENEAVGLKAFEATRLASTGRPHQAIKSGQYGVEQKDGGLRVEKVKEEVKEETK